MNLAADPASGLTDWLSAWGQIAGAVATVAAVIVALWIASSDRRRADRDRAEEARHRAGRVVTSLYGPVVTITNYMSTPIWAPQVVSCTLLDLPDVAWKSRAQGAARQVLGPGEEVEVRGDWVKADDDQVRVHEFPDEFEFNALIEFVDVEGRQWRREAEAAPVLMPSGRPDRPRRLQLGQLGIEWGRRPDV